jgi:uncharacterized protein YdeI (YjbR/CyaY-like superfamily)
MSEDALFFPDEAAFEEWLDQNASCSDGIWIKMAKKHTGRESLDWVGAVDVVLCFGWIDGQSKRVDDDWFIQRVTPRRPRSLWSKINRGKVEALIASGRMRPAGLAEVERAREDGRLARAYDGAATAGVPDDLTEALQDAGLTDRFAALDSRNRYAILHRVQTAKRPETRARRIARFVDMLTQGELLYPQTRDG